MKVLVVFAILAVGIQSTNAEPEEQAALEHGVRLAHTFIERAAQSVSELKKVLAEFEAIKYPTENHQIIFLMGVRSKVARVYNLTKPHVAPSSQHSDQDQPEALLDVAWKDGFDEMTKLFAAAANNLCSYKKELIRLYKFPNGPYGSVPAPNGTFLSQLQDKYWSGQVASIALLNKGNK